MWYERLHFGGNAGNWEFMEEILTRIIYLADKGGNRYLGDYGRAGIGIRLYQYHTLVCTSMMAWNIDVVFV